jgi:hypothetical protein
MDHPIGTVLLEVLALMRAGHADDEPKPAGSASLHTGNGVFDNKGSLRGNA